MPNDQPNSAADLPVEARDADTAAAVLHDGGMDAAPGGGALRGAAAADSLGGSGRTPHGASPNAPIDTGVDAGEANAAADAKVQAADEAQAHPS